MTSLVSSGIQAFHISNQKLSQLDLGCSLATIGADVLFLLASVSHALAGKRRLSGGGPIQATLSFGLSLVLTVCLIGLNLGASLWLGALHFRSEQRNLQSVVFVVQLFLQLITCIGSLLVLLSARRRRERLFPACLRAWWLVTFLVSVARFVLDLVHRTSPNDFVYQWISFLSIPPTFLLGVVALWRKDILLIDHGLEEPLLNGANGEAVKKGEDEVTPYATAGFWSILTFSWINPVLAVGAKRPLEPEDLPQLAPQHRGSTVYSNFHEEWERVKQASVKNGESPSLVRALVNCYWKEAAAISLFVIVNSVAAYIGPYLIEDFVNYLSGIHRFRYEGPILAGVFLATKMVENVCLKHWFVTIQVMAMKLRTALTACVYRKGLRLSSPSRQSHTSGEIVNYMAVDIQRVIEFTWYVHDALLLPIQLVAAMAVLYNKVGLASLSTILAMVVCIALNAPFSKLMEKYQDNVMQAKDVRMRATTECLKSMKILKLQAWEKAYLRKLVALRHVEFGWLRKSFYAQAGMTFLFWTSPMLVGVATFGTCLVLKIPLTTGRVLSALATFRILQEPLSSFPDFLSMLAQVKVSLERINSFLNETELQEDAVSRVPRSSITDEAVHVEEGEFSWDGSSENVTLSNINLSVSEGMTVAVCGMVGAGKSSLLSCVLGEVPRLSGSVKVKGRTAYVGQTAWIQSGKIEDNILFGSPMDRSKYDYVLKICQLKKDLEILPYGDQTEIGERGINLSGGQKQRIQLARAVYQDADIYLLDDPFSAVDVQTGTQIFKDCILGALASKTIILVTHQVEFLPAADLILVLKNGRITQAGTYNDLLEEETDFTELVGAHHKAMEVINQADKIAGRGEGILDNDDKKSREVEKKSQEESEPAVQQLVQEEEREKGSVGLKVYWSYCTAVYRGGLVPCALAAHLGFQLLQIASNWWMAGETPTTSAQTPQVNPNRLITGYALFSLGAALCLLVRVLLVNTFGLATSQKLFFDMLNCIFHAPMSFFDSTPTGRILSRASTDQSQLDMNVPFRVAGVAFSGIQLLCIAAVMSQASWQILVVFIPVFCLCVMLQNYYISSGRELSRLQGVQKAPIIHHYSETITGASTVRGFGQEERFMERNIFLIDTAARAIFHSAVAMEWVSFRLELLTNAVFTFCLLLLVFLPPGTIKPSLAGLAVTYGLNLNVIQSWFVWNICMAEQKIISVERIQQYSRIPSEAPWEIEATRPPESWPAKGNVELVDLKVRYNTTAPFVLHGINVRFPGGKKVGVVGRTGSGKSTLIQAIFRIVEPTGKIVIDDVDITLIGLHDLRSKLSIIPQDPTLFEGTVRYNLDPLDQYSDHEIWEALDKCQLGDLVRSKEEKLGSPVAENGENWSVGQRQLFCLGRVMLKRSRVLVLDEATASVDSATDGVIQSTIATKFEGCTVITIAHRLPTVVDSDYVMVLDDGRMIEFGEPAKLLEKNSSHFKRLVAEYSQRTFG